MAARTDTSWSESSLGHSFFVQRESCSDRWRFRSSRREHRGKWIDNQLDIDQKTKLCQTTIATPDKGAANDAATF